MQIRSLEKSLTSYCNIPLYSLHLGTELLFSFHLATTGHRTMVAFLLSEVFFHFNAKL